MLPKKYTFSGGEMIHHDNDIIIVKYRLDQKITNNDMLDQRMKRIEMIGETPYYPIIDMREGVVHFTEEAKAWAAVNSESAKSRILDILVVDGAIMKMKAKFYTMMYKPTNKTKIFKSIDQAFDFISEHKKSKA